MEGHAARMRRLADAVLNTPGELPPVTRHAITARARGRPDGPDELPTALRPYVDTVVRHAYRVTAEDVAALRTAGFSEDAIFEATLAAALSAGLVRLERGLAALRGGA